MTNWNHRFFNLALHVSEWSKDPRTKVGSVVVNDLKQVIGLGFNGFPRGVEDYSFRYENRDVKLLYVSHAEQNALDNCFTDPRGATLYASLFPCCHCTKSIIQRGIRHVIAPQPDPTRFGAPLHFEVSLKMMREAGILFTAIEDLNESTDHTH